MSKINKTRFEYFLVLSLAIHLLMTLGSFLTPSPAPKREQEIEITLREEEPVQKQEESKAKQIVEQEEKAMNKEIDPNAKFLSRNNQAVKKQTVAKNHGEFQNQKKAMNAFLPQFEVQDAQAKNEQREKDLDALQVAKMLEKKAAAQPKASASASQTFDYIKDLDPGLETMLSTREFVYYTYYNRIRAQLNQYWTPEVQETVKKIYAAGRKLASDADKITKCLVTLDNKGQVLRVQIIGESGVRDLDEAAVRAFKQASPFLNPPQGMVENDGTIRIRWDFILEA